MKPVSGQRCKEKQVMVSCSVRVVTASGGRMGLWAATGRQGLLRYWGKVVFLSLVVRVGVFIRYTVLYTLQHDEY